MLATYSSNVFVNHSDVKSADFIKEYEEEVAKLKTKLDNGLKKIKLDFKDSGEPISTNLNIVLNDIVDAALNAASVNNFTSSTI
jgi:hypothetical protein